MRACKFSGKAIKQDFCHLKVKWNENFTTSRLDNVSCLVTEKFFPFRGDNHAFSDDSSRVTSFGVTTSRRLGSQEWPGLISFRVNWI